MTTAFIYLFIPFFAFIVLGVPIAFAIGLACLVFLAFSGIPIPWSSTIAEMYSSIDSFAILALPTFVLTGELLNRCKLTQKIINVASLMVGWMRGGLGHVVVVSSMFFSGISGSAIADVAAVGPIMIPAMIREKYPRDYAGALTAAASIMGPIIPPSIPMIIIGSQLGISVGGLFAAGVLPGVLIGLVLMLLNYYFAVRHNYGGQLEFRGVGAIVKGSWEALPALVIPVWLLGGILFGVFTPTEAGAVAVLYTVVVGFFFYRTLSLSGLYEALLAAAKVTAGALVIVMTAFLFSKFLTYYKVPQQALEFLLGISSNRTVIILIIIALFLFVGTFMDALANMIILGPLLMPICVGDVQQGIQGLGMHPLQFGMLLNTGLLLGLLTPPVGLCLFVTAPLAGVTIERLSLAVIPFLIAETAILLLIAFVPEVSLFVPRLAGLVN
jgi:C4-dicarboxylate transporter DctM subunit